MTNTELIAQLVTLFSAYMTFMLPVIGILAGIHLILNWVWSILFRPFDH
jgi:hypothetical protein